MTRRDFDELVGRIGSRYDGRQLALERATTAWVVFGLAGLLSWLALVFAAGIALFAVGIVLPQGIGIVAIAVAVLVLVYGVAQAGMLLVVDLGKPEGRALKSGEAPELLAMLDGLRRDIRC